jgi:hypothetical protein|tara:strand:+ start:573 stop:887 length:315 start_codon:yes stop_codon:yes gene_type:complete
MTKILRVRKQMEKTVAEYEKFMTIPIIATIQAVLGMHLVGSATNENITLVGLNDYVDNQVKKLREKYQQDWAIEETDDDSYEFCWHMTSDQSNSWYRIFAERKE